MLKFVSGYLAFSYLAFAGLVVAGLLQVLAARRSFAGLALLDYRRTPPWRRAFGPLLIVLAYIWFFGTRREILTPGPAGAELVILFGGAVLLAVGVTVLVAAVLRPYKQPAAQALAAEAHTVSLDQGSEALLFQNSQQDGAGPGICLLPDPGVPAGTLHALAGRLAQEGLTVLVPQWPASKQQGPSALALASTAISFLSRQPLVDAGRLVAGGAGLGADLALRAAAENAPIQAVIALAPEWSERSAQAGLGLLQEVTYPEALRWGLQGRRRTLLAGLASSQAIGRLGSRPALILYGEADAIVSPAQARACLDGAGPAVELQILPAEGHLSLAAGEGVHELIAHWLAEKLKVALPEGQ